MEKRHSTIWILRFFHLAIFFNLVTAKSEYTKLFERCTKEKNTFDCFKRHALEILTIATQDNSVYKINDYISITKDAALTARNYNSMTSENDTELSLDEKLDNKFYEYLSSRSVKLTIPGNAFEGRKKKGRFGYLIVAGAVLAGMMAQLAYGKIAFLAGTALLTAKMALVLSAIVGLKKLFSSGGGGHEVIYATASEHGGGGGGGGYGGWQRAMEVVPPT
ncbi:Osiris 16 [Camponotus japonicus]